METVTAQEDNAGPSPDNVKNEDGDVTQGGGRSSPPPKCAICLGTCRNKSFTDSCLHQFCFKCLLTWSKVKTVCPLCKQNFRSIIHNVRSNHQYEEYMVEQRNNEDSTERAETVARFRYSTTLTMPRHESIAIQQLLLQHYPMISNMLPPAPARRRRHSNAFRRTIYRHNLWARPLPDFTGRFRDCNPEFYRYNETQMHRLVPWLTRELHYLLTDNLGHISYVMSRILELLPQMHIHSAEFREAIHRYLGDRTEHFLHELYCFATTPYDLTGYDRNVQYTTDTRVSTLINELDSSSESEASVDSDIIMISSSMPAEPAAGPSGAPGPPRYPAPLDNSVIPIETILHSDTDDDSEVMVVGYIKPPQDRTPEIVDLLGSDSDVIVQDTIPPEPEPAENRTVSLVKLSLKCSRPREIRGSESEDSTYSPPRPRRKRRRRSADPAAAADTRGATPPPAGHREAESVTTTPSTSSSTTWSSQSSSTSSSSYSPLSDSTVDYYESSEENRKVSKRKMKRNRTSERDNKKSKQRKTSSDYRESDKLSKRKSYSGKGVKSSNKRNDRSQAKRNSNERSRSPKQNTDQSHTKNMRNDRTGSAQSNTDQSQTKNTRNGRSKSPQSNTDQSHTENTRNERSKSPQSTSGQSKTKIARNPRSRSPQSTSGQSKTKNARNPRSRSPISNSDQSQSKHSRNDRARSPKLNREQLQANLDYPIASTSGTSSYKKHKSDKNHKHSKPSHEKKRLKSVVRVIKSKKTVTPPNGNENLVSDVTQSGSRLSSERERNSIDELCYDSSDSEDNIPLNLTIHKMTH